MKHLSFIASILLCLFAIPSFAQLMVFEDGKVSIKRQTENPYAQLSVEESENSSFSSYNMAIGCSVENDNHFNIGVMSTSYQSAATSSGRCFGIVGTAGNATSGCNYGVYGRLWGSNNGAAVVGSLNANMGIQIPGTYAGYFDGATRVNGTMTATSYTTLSDMRLKENVEPLSEAEGDQTTLTKVLNMNVVKYNYKEQNEIPNAEKDTIQVGAVKQESASKDKHYGLLAQQLQALYPDLVVEGQDGYLSVNYVELVPILIRAI